MPLSRRCCVLGDVPSSGCKTFLVQKQPFVPPEVPKELSKMNLPEYRVEPPDILLIEAVRAIPKPPYKAEPLDVLYVALANAIPNEPLAGQISVEPDGTINLGPNYGGSVLSVVGKTIPEIKALLENTLATTLMLKEPKVTVSLAQGRASQRTIRHRPPSGPTVPSRSAYAIVPHHRR